MPDNTYEAQILVLLQRIALALEAIAHNTQEHPPALP
jgi:hypothetical protein